MSARDLNERPLPADLRPTLERLATADAAARRRGPAHEVDARVLERLQQAVGAPANGGRTLAPDERARGWLWGAPLALSAVAVVLLWVGAPRSQSDSLQGKTAGLANVCTIDDGGRLVANHDCAAYLPQHRVQVEAMAGAQLVVGPRAVELLGGEAVFDVDKRRAGERSFQVKAMGARVEVLGTRFLVEVQSEAGEVFLEHGRIQLHRADGTTLLLLPGEGASLTHGPVAALNSRNDRKPNSAPEAPPQMWVWATERLASSTERRTQADAPGAGTVPQADGADSAHTDATAMALAPAGGPAGRRADRAVEWQRERQDDWKQVPWALPASEQPAEVMGAVVDRGVRRRADTAGGSSRSSSASGQGADRGRIAATSSATGSLHGSSAQRARRAATQGGSRNSSARDTAAGSHASPGPSGGAHDDAALAERGVAERGVAERGVAERQKANKASPTEALADTELEQALIEIRRLRAGRGYRLALARVEALMAHDLDGALRAGLSFERGELLTLTGASDRLVCAHWLDHQARFGEDRFASRIAQLLEQHRCER